jgi:hypothetical protein
LVERSSYLKNSQGTTAIATCNVFPSNQQREMLALSKIVQSSLQFFVIFSKGWRLKLFSYSENSHGASVFAILQNK